MPLFKNKSALITFNPDKFKQEPTVDEKLSPEKVNLIAEKTKEVAKFVAVTAVAAYAVVRTIDTISQIAVKKTKSADNEE